MRRFGTWNRVAEGCAGGLFLVYALLLFGHREPLSLTDYADWTYQGVLLTRHLRGLPDLHHWLKTYAVPNSAATLGIGLLALVLPWMLAAKLWLVVQLGVNYAALRHVLRTLGGSGWLWLVLPQVLFLNVNFWYGFVNFQLGLCWVLLMISLLLRRLPAGALPDWPLGLLLVVAFLTHMIPFGFAGLLLLLYAVQSGRWRVMLQAIPAAVLCAWYVWGRFVLAGDADGDAGMKSTVRTYSRAFWEYKANSYVKSFGLANPGGRAPDLLGGGVYTGLFGVNLLLSVVLGAALLMAARRAFRERRPERFVWIGIGLLLPVYLLAPGAALGVSDPGARLLQVALAAGLVLTVRLRGWLLPVAAGAGSCLALAGILLFSRYGHVGPYSASVPAQSGVVSHFARVPNGDQDWFYGAIDAGDWDLRVFPTGMFLNQPSR